MISRTCFGSWAHNREHDSHSSTCVNTWFTHHVTCSPSSSHRTHDRASPLSLNWVELKMLTLFPLRVTTVRLGYSSTTVPSLIPSRYEPITDAHPPFALLAWRPCH